MIRGAFIVCKRELAALFLSPVALVFLGMFLLLSGFLTFMAGGFFELGQANLDAFFMWHPWLFLFFAPAIAMRLWSSEKQSGTLELLFTMPLSPGSAILGKFFAAWLLTGTALLLTFPAVLTVNYLGSPDNGVIAAGYLGSWLMAGACVAVASACSARTRHAVAGFLPAVGILLFLLLAGWPPVTNLLAPHLGERVVDGIAEMSIITHFESMRRGVIDIRDVLYFVSIILLGLAATRVFLRPFGGVGALNSMPALLLLALLLIGGNWVVDKIPARMDWTSGRIFTLSQGTLDLLKSPPAPVEARLYATRGKDMPGFLKAHSARVEEMLAEFAERSGGNLRVRILEPLPDSPEEDAARLDGVMPQLLSNGKKVYLGLSFRSLDRTRSISFLLPARDRLLEYDLASAIAEATQEKQRVVGLISPLALSPAQQAQPVEALPGQEWVVHSEWNRRFDLRPLSIDLDAIPPDIEVLVLVHPKNLPDRTLRAVDRFMTSGGRLLAFLDPLSPFDNRDPIGMFSEPEPSNLEPLLSAWGIRFRSDQLVADPVFATDTARGRHPAILSLDETSLSAEDPATAESDSATVVFSGVFEGAAKPGLEETVLLRSSNRAVLVNPVEARDGGEALLPRVSESTSGEERALAIRLTGNFPPAFAENGKVSSPLPGAAVLFGDSDFLRDAVAVREIAAPGGQRLFVPANGNLPIAEAAIENLLGDSRLISLRGRASRNHPFTVLKLMQTRAEDAFGEKLAELEEMLSATEKRLNALQQPVPEGGAVVLSDEQQRELSEFRKEESRIRAEIREVRRGLRAEIEKMQNRITWINIASVPVMLVLFVIVSVSLRHHRRNRSRGEKRKDSR